MKLKLGLKGKLVGMVLMVLVAFVVGGGQVYRIYNELLETSNTLEQSVDHLGVIKDIQQELADANLLGMDIIVDHSENLNNRKVEREGDLAEFGKRVHDYKEAVKKRDGDLAFIEKVLPAIDSADKMVVAVTDLVNAIKQGEKNPAVFSKADEDIDGAKESGTAQLQVLRTETEKSFKDTNAKLDNLFADMLKSIGVTFAACIALLSLFGLPLIFSVTSSVSKLNHQLSEITKSVQGTSGELGSISMSLAESSTESAAAIQESVSAMTEMGAMISQTTRNSMTTANLSKSALHETEQGVRTMEELSMSMRSISDSSNRLKEIIRIIDDISTKTKVINDVVFKTQLLAVNASIEAARAGQHGKGFSVVANEVASLAAMSGKASNEINELLRNSSSQVEEIIQGTSESIKAGERVTEKTSSAFGQIAQSISEISEKVDEISAASKEQESGVSQTSAALREMNQATGSASAMAQKNATIGRELKSHANKLVSIRNKLETIVAGSADTGIKHEEKQDRPSKTDHNSDEHATHNEETSHESHGKVSVLSLAQKIRSEEGGNDDTSEQSSDKLAV